MKVFDRSMLLVPSLLLWSVLPSQVMAQGPLLDLSQRSSEPESQNTPIPILRSSIPPPSPPAPSRSSTARPMDYIEPEFVKLHRLKQDAQQAALRAAKEAADRKAELEKPESLDMTSYLNELGKKLDAQYLFLKKGRSSASCGVVMLIDKTGKLLEPRLLWNLGDSVSNALALKAVRNLGTFRPLPFNLTKIGLLAHHTSEGFLVTVDDCLTKSVCPDVLGASPYYIERKRQSSLAKVTSIGCPQPGLASCSSFVPHSSSVPDSRGNEMSSKTSGDRFGAGTSTSKIDNKVSTASVANSADPDVNRLLADKKFAEASAILDRVLKVTPTDGKAWFNYGLCRQALKDYHGAIAAYEMCVTLSPGDGAAKAAAEQVRAFLDKEKQAKEAAQAAEQESLRKLTELEQMVQNGRFRDAAEMGGAMIRTEQTNDKIWFLLGIAKQSLLDYHGALGAYEMAARLEPLNQAASAAVVKLRSYLVDGVSTAPPLPSVGIPGAPTQSSEHVNYNPYLQDLARRISRAWFPVGGYETLRTSVVFKVALEGVAHHIRLYKASGEKSVDQAALKAVENAAPFRYLPPGSPDEIEVRAYFESGSDLSVDPSTMSIYVRQKQLRSF